jgi:hypothetical protein
VTVRIADGVLYLEDHCRVEEAEALLVALQEQQAKIIDISRLARIHLALAQILFAQRPQIRGVPSDPFLRNWLLPLLRSAD